MKYKNIKTILRTQIKMGSLKKWAWIKEDKEFICVYRYIPPQSTELYTPLQLLNKLEGGV